MLPPKIGALTHYVNDFSGVLSPEQREKLDALFQQIENTSGKQVVVVIFPHREGRELLDIGMEIFNGSGIGEKKRNNGLLLLLVSEEKKLRILVGKGLEFIYTDEWCHDIIENHLRPLLNEGKYHELVLMWKNKLQENNTINGGTQIPINSKNLSIKIILIFIGFIIIFFTLILFSSRESQKFCSENPEICEQRQREKENKFCETRPASCIDGRIDYNSSDYKKYEQEIRRSSSSSSSHSSSSSFGGGGGSSNGAGAGD